MQIPVLTYHGVNIIRNSYQENDHIALARDLETIDQLGFKVIPLSKVFAWHQGQINDHDVLNSVAITFDDGSWFDFHDLNHPTCGPQRSMLNILKDFHEKVGYSSQPELHATSFVISSPDARTELDLKGLIGKRWWGDEWWLEATETNLMSIECHSWDHVHPDLDQVAQKEQIKGSFLAIDNLGDCHIQVAKAGDYIQHLLKVRPNFFAFPWGEADEYLSEEYLPNYQQRHGFLAAFSTDPKPVQKSDSKWNLPRYIFGRDWVDPSGLNQVLEH